MPKHPYSTLTVNCKAPIDFTPDRLRDAVEYLRTVPPATAPWHHVGLTAIAIVNAGKLKLRARAFLTLDQITGKTPAQVWTMFDDQVDNDIEGLMRRKS